MSRNRLRREPKSQPHNHRRSSRTARAIVVATAIVAVFVVGLISRAVIRRHSTGAVDDQASEMADSRVPSDVQSTAKDSNVDLTAAANQLFQSVSPSLPQNQYFPQFAKERLLWIQTQRNAGNLSIQLLKNVDNADLNAEDLMASGRVEGRAVIVIAGPRFARLLMDGGRISAPFTQEQRNDFALGLVHEVVHLENQNPPDPARLEDRLAEELRAWSVVDLNVARPLRRLNQPMNLRFTEADDAIRTCGDKLPCEALRQILVPTEIGR